MKTSLVTITYKAPAYPDGHKIKVGKGQEEREVDVSGEEIKDANYIGEFVEKEFSVEERITRLKVLDRARLMDKMNKAMKSDQGAEAVIVFNMSQVMYCVIDENGKHKYTLNQLADFETEKQQAYKKAVEEHNAVPDALEVGKG